MAEQHLSDADAAGLTTPDKDLAGRDTLPARAAKAIIAYAANDPLDYTKLKILDVELELTDWGRTRIDLGFEDARGVGVLDYKTTGSLSSKYIEEKRKESYKHSEQALMYPAAYGDYLGRPVYRFDILLCVLEPKFRVISIPHIVNPTVQADWYESRLSTWARMEATFPDGELHDEMAASHADQYGECEFTRVCFDFKGDEALALASGEFVIKDKT